MHNIAVAVALCFGVSANTVLADFSDSFEGPLDSSFWSTASQSGYVVCPSSTRAHSGSYSVELVTTDTGANKNVRIYHTFAAPTYGTVSFWVFDTAADFASGNSVTFYVARANSIVADIWTPDYDLGPGQNGSTYYWGALGGYGPTAIDRTRAWHQFTISCLSDSLTLKIDGIVIYSGPGGQQFDEVDMSLSGPYWRPPWSMQFDDFSFQEAVPPNTSPVAKCKDVTVSADANCSGSASVDDGSFDPDGDPITLTQTPPGPYPLGTTAVTLTVTDDKGASSSCSATVTVADTTPPVVHCTPMTNPSGKNVPKAGSKSASGQNPDGFYELVATDNCDSAPQIFIQDSASGFIAGPFVSGAKIKITQAPGVMPDSKPMSGVILAHILLKGDALAYAVDAAGNLSTPCSCLVPPKPK